MTFAEYVWIDGTKPTPKLRSKTKILTESETSQFNSGGKLPEWSFDGSSTNQATGSRSDCVLRPVFHVRDPIRGGDALLVMCEVFDPDGTTPHASNSRARLREIVDAAGSEATDCWFGLEQEYTLFRGSRPAGFPENGFPSAQGPYYCGVGADEVTGRPLVEAHAQACVKAGLSLSGINAEVMPGQWEFQIGPLGPLAVGDQLWLARWLLYRIGEDFGLSATLDPKPAKGDWNGAGMHSNFSTLRMRSPGGLAEIEAWCEKASVRREEHLAAYGDGYETRLTGAHETCSYRDFKWGYSDRTASIRIPLATKLQGYGYLEDRRPNANADPYRVAEVMLKTAFGAW